MAHERTLAIIKPDACKMGVPVVIAILGRYVEANLALVEVKSFIMGPDLFERFYGQHKDKPFYEKLRAFSVGGQMVALCVAGDNAVKKVRDINGSTNPAQARVLYPTSIRSLYGRGDNEPTNAVHGSDSVESAEREIELIFG